MVRGSQHCSVQHMVGVQKTATIPYHHKEIFSDNSQNQLQKLSKVRENHLEIKLGNRYRFLENCTTILVLSDDAFFYLYDLWFAYFNPL